MIQWERGGVDQQEQRDGIPRVDVTAPAEIPAALDELGLAPGRPVLVLVGGAAGMTDDHLVILRSVLQDIALPLLQQVGAAVVDGGTDSGVMRVVGAAHHAGGAGFPLIGVAAEGTVKLPGRTPSRDDAADLDAHHTHFVLVPGDEWGDESSWIADVADALSASDPSVTLVVNGGGITVEDAAASIGRGRPVIVLAGTGRTADAIAHARTQGGGEPSVIAVATSALTSVVNIDDLPGIGAALEAALTPR